MKNMKIDLFEYTQERNTTIKVCDFLEKFKDYCKDDIFINITSDDYDVIFEVFRYETEEEKEIRLLKQYKEILDKLTTKEREVAISLIKRGIRLS